MSSITDMTLPDEVVEKAARAIFTELGWGDGDENFDWRHLRGEANAAIRAALQAMCDCGMAKRARLEIFGHGDWEAGSEWNDDEMSPAIIIRLDADERKEQT